MRTLLISFLVLLACTTTDSDSKDSLTFSEAFPGALQVKGVQLTDEQGVPVVLRGVSLGWHNWWPRFYQQGTVRHLRQEWNATVIRAAMGIDVANGYLQNPVFAKENVGRVVEEAIRQNMYVIIDWHSHHLYEEEAKVFFAEMAQKYGDYPHVIYEIYNEPIDETWSQLKSYSESVIAAIRKHDPDNLILIGTPRWSQEVDAAALDPIQGHSNLMYVLHFYAGTHQKWLRDKADLARSKGLAIFVSECAGMDADGNGPIDQNSWTEWVNWMESRRISWLAWSIADKDETCSMLYPSASNSGPWSDDHLKPWGRQVKQLLIEKN